MHFLIIGGDAAGMSAASRARRNQPEMKITVLEQTRDVSYSACGMPYNIADPARDMDDLVARRASVFREKQDIDLLTGHRADFIDRSNRIVGGQSADGKIFQYSYDKMLIATGASPVRPDLPGLDLRGVMTLKSLQDGRMIKQYMKDRSVSRVVIIGMGYIGMEMAEAFTARDLMVDMISIDFLPGFHSQIQDIVRESLLAHKVRLHPEYRLESVERKGDALQVMFDGQKTEVDMVLLGIGIMPNSALAKNAGLNLGPHKSVAVDQSLKTSDDDIYAAGDCADAFHVVTGERTWIPLGLRANRAGWAAADSISGKPVSLPGVAGTAVFKVFDLQVARTGLNLAEAKKAGFSPVEVMIKGRSRAHSHPGSDSLWVQMVGDVPSGRLLGVQMVGREGVAHRINAPAVALHNKMTVADFSQTDMAYAPPFSPVWDPMLVAANQLLKEM
jgi:NADPH-dependent 2,4-dienoyl-CoA reductase/sulfur reductase-like enzyme